jgi:O-antigen ligase
VIAITFNLHDFSGRSTTAAVTRASSQSALELLLFGLVGLTALVVLRLRPSVVRPGPMWIALPTWVVASAFWSSFPAYTIARGLEYVAMSALALASTTLVGADAAAFERLMWSTIRWVIRATLVLMALGVAFGPRLVLAAAENAGRFTWIGAHPTQSSFLMGASLLLALAAPAHRLGVPGWGKAAMVAAFGVGLYANESRTALAATILGAAVIGWRHIRARPEHGVAAIPALVLATVGVLVATGSNVGSYVLRGGDASTLTSLNGRTDLWSVGLAALDSPAAWLHGLGFGATRTVFVADFSFASSAHNSLLGQLVNLGIVGVAIVVVLLVTTLTGLARSEPRPVGDHVLPLLAVMAFVVAIASTADELAEPTFGTAMVLLASTAAAVRRHQRTIGSVAAAAEVPHLAE